MKTFLEWMEQNVTSAHGEIPPAPGTSPIPEGHLRLYHYFPYESDRDERGTVASLWGQGINFGNAKGHTYGEPNMVWASGTKPQDDHAYVEFSVAWDDPRHAGVKMRKDSIALAKNWNFPFRGSIRPDEFIAIHLPWHNHVRDFRDGGQVEDVLSGRFDNLLDFGDYGKAIKFIKSHAVQKLDSPQ